MTRYKTSGLKKKLHSAMVKSRVAPRWVVLKKYRFLKRAAHISSWSMNPQMRRNWRRNRIQV